MMNLNFFFFHWFQLKVFSWCKFSIKCQDDFLLINLNNKKFKRFFEQFKLTSIPSHNAILNQWVIQLCSMPPPYFIALRLNQRFYARTTRVPRSPFRFPFHCVAQTKTLSMRRRKRSDQFVINARLVHIVVAHRSLRVVYLFRIN